MLTKERVWSEQERQWVAALKDHELYEIMPLSELYAMLPEPGAFGEVKKRFGELGGTTAGGGGSWCKLEMAHQEVEMLRDAVCLIHGTLNCNACIRNFHSHLFHQWGHGFVHTPTTAIDKRQVVFGGEDELYEAIKAVDRDYRPQLIVVMPGCAPSLVQDDIARIIQRAQPEVSAKLHWHSTAGYEMLEVGTIIEDVTQLWIDLIDPPAKVDKDAVNIVGAAREVYWKHARGACGERPHPYPSDADVLGGYVEQLGLRVHRVLVAGGDYEYLRTSAEAATNVVACGTWGFPLAEAMKAKFGIPYLREELPLGVEASSRWIRGLAKMTGREEEAEKLIEREYAALADVWEECQTRVAGKTLICGGAGNRAASYLRFGKELGCDVIYIPGTPEMGAVGEQIIKPKHVDWEYFFDYGFDPMVIRIRDEAPIHTRHDYRLYYAGAVANVLGIDEDHLIFMYCDFAAAGHMEPSRVTYVNSSTHQRRRPGYPSRAVGFVGTKGMCLDLIEATKISQRKGNPTLMSRIHGS